jgi:hypothetical protein
MKTIALLALLTVGVFTTAGCHHHWNNHHNYSDGYYRR